MRSSSRVVLLELGDATGDSAPVIMALMESFSAPSRSAILIAVFLSYSMLEK